MAVGLVAGLSATNASGGGSGPDKRAGKGCPDGYLCLWADTNYEGQKVKIHGKGLSNQLYKEMNDNAESLKFRREGGAVLYTNTDGDSVDFCVTHGPTNFNNLFEGSNVASSTRISKKPVPSECKNPKAGHGAKADTNKVCPKKALCVWDKPKYKGQRVVVKEKGVLSTKIAEKMNDRTSSAKNTWKYTSYLYEDDDGGGQASCVEPHDKIPDFSVFFDPFDDEASSAQLPENASACV